MKRLLKNSRGMTFTELLIAILIFSLVTAVISTMLVSVLRAYESANDFAEYNALLDTVANRIISDLSSSTREPGLDGDGGQITVFAGSAITEYAVGSGGVLLRNGSPVFDTDYYKGKSIEIKCEPSSPGMIYILRVTVFSEGGAAVSRDYAVKPLALNQYAN